jgi:hypothetical protein
MRVSKMLGATMVAGAPDARGPAGDPAGSTASTGARSTYARADPARGGPRTGARPNRQPAPGAAWR